MTHDTAGGVGCVPDRILGDTSFVVLVACSGTSGTAPTGARTVVWARSRGSTVGVCAADSFSRRQGIVHDLELFCPLSLRPFLR
jgi:hypothetical protein